VAEKPHNAVLKFDTYRTLLRHRTVISAIARHLVIVVSEGNVSTCLLLTAVKMRPDLHWRTWTKWYHCCHCTADADASGVAMETSSFSRRFDSICSAADIHRLSDCGIKCTSTLSVSATASSKAHWFRLGNLSVVDRECVRQWRKWKNAYRYAIAYRSLFS